LGIAGCNRTIVGLKVVAAVPAARNTTRRVAIAP